MLEDAEMVKQWEEAEFLGPLEEVSSDQHTLEVEAMSSLWCPETSSNIMRWGESHSLPRTPMCFVICLKESSLAAESCERYFSRTTLVVSRRSSGCIR